MDNGPRPLRRPDNPAGPRSLAARCRRRHPLLPHPRMGQALQLQGVDRRGLADLLLSGSWLRHAAGPLQLQQVQQQLLQGRHTNEQY